MSDLVLTVLDRHDEGVTPTSQNADISGQPSRSVSYSRVTWLDSKGGVAGRDAKRGPES